MYNSTFLNCYYVDNICRCENVPVLNVDWELLAAKVENDTSVDGKKISPSFCVSLVVGVIVSKALVVTGFEIVKDDVFVREPENKLDENDADVLGNTELVDLADASNDVEPVAVLSEFFNPEVPKIVVASNAIVVFVIVFG